MPLLAGDIRFARSANMADVPEGGGPPSSQLLTSGRSNEIFPDISEETRTTGRVEIYQIFGVLRNTDRTPFMGCNVILAEPPADPNVSVTLLSLKSPFATRADIARRIESGMAAGSEFSGYLLENHYTTMRSIQIFQRPGMPPPAIGRTFVLVYNEGQAGERRQRIRVKSTDTVTRMFTETSGGQLVDFLAQVTTCELFDGLLYDFPGSPAPRSFARAAGKTLTRETVYSDSGLFYSATRLTAATAINDAWLQLASIYTQVVPNSRSEVASVDQMPAARRTILLAEAPRRVEVGITPHTQRYKIQEENAGLTFVWQCTPLPEPGTIFIDFWALGQRYTLTDDGNGKLVGAGGGAVNYLTGSISATLKSIPDIGSSIALTHGARVSYTSRANQGAAIRAPEYCWVVGGQDESTKNDRIVPGTLVVKYPSAGIVRTATETGTGKFAGDASGVVDYHSRTVLLRPSFMPDPGAELHVECQLETLVTEFINAGPDATGIAAFSLAQQPTAGTLQIEWCVARAVSQTAGGNLTTTTSSKTADVNYIFKATPEWQEPQSPGQNIAIRAAYV